MALQLNTILTAGNLTSKLDDTYLDKVGGQLVGEIESDNATRSDWLSRNEEWIKLATQVMEEKNTPWPGASNVKYPLLTTAAMQFAARAYPALVSGSKVAKAIPVGYDPTGDKMMKADRISKHMSYQILYKMPNWEEDMDRMLFSLPIIGTTFKKSYFDPYKQSNISEYIDPRYMVVDYYARSIEDAERKTHILYLYENEVIEKIRGGIFRDVELGTPSHKMREELKEDTQGFSKPSVQEGIPYELYECHCWLDLDEDGYKEPYIVTILSHSSKVVRIVPRFDIDSVILNDSNQIAKIDPDEYFTNFVFIPDPNSAIYGLGFGALLGPINEAINTLTNQLIDAGTINNSVSGFLGRGIKLRSGDAKFKPNEWKYTNSTGDDLRKNIFPLPTKEPSNVLYLALGFLTESGQKLSATMDVMVGESPGQNQPAQTTMAVMEQGLKVYTSIHKRIYRAFSKELRKLFELNSKYLNDAEYFVVLDAPNLPTEQIARYDYNPESFDIYPSGDPNVVTQAQKLVKAQGLLQLMQSGIPLNMQEVRMRVLEAMEMPGIDRLVQVPPPQPDFETQLKMEQFKWQQEKEKQELQLDAQRIASEAVKDEAQAILSEIKAQVAMREAANKELEIKLTSFADISNNSLETKKVRDEAKKKETE